VAILSGFGGGSLASGARLFDYVAFSGYREHPGDQGAHHLQQSAASADAYGMMKTGSNVALKESLDA
jgi:hypothetical protein